MCYLWNFNVDITAILRAYRTFQRSVHEDKGKGWWPHSGEIWNGLSHALFSPLVVTCSWLHNDRELGKWCGKFHTTKWCLEFLQGWGNADHMGFDLDWQRMTPSYHLTPWACAPNSIEHLQYKWHCTAICTQLFLKQISVHFSTRFAYKIFVLFIQQNFIHLPRI